MIPLPHRVKQSKTLIKWRTNEISGTIMRDDTEDHQWKKISSIMDSEADAEAAIKQFLSIAGEP